MKVWCIFGKWNSVYYKILLSLNKTFSKITSFVNVYQSRLRVGRWTDLLSKCEAGRREKRMPMGVCSLLHLRCMTWALSEQHRVLLGWKIYSSFLKVLTNEQLEFHTSRIQLTYLIHSSTTNLIRTFSKLPSMYPKLVEWLGYFGEVRIATQTCFASLGTYSWKGKTKTKTVSPIILTLKQFGKVDLLLRNSDHQLVFPVARTTISIFKHIFHISLEHTLPLIQQRIY